jgi:hypothetical protein
MHWLWQAASASRCGSAAGTRLAILSVSPTIIEFIGTSIPLVVDDGSGRFLLRIRMTITGSPNGALIAH